MRGNSLSFLFNTIGMLRGEIIVFFVLFGRKVLFSLFYAV